MNVREYRVAFTGLAREQFLAAVRSAESVDRPAELTAALRRLFEELSVNPTEIGEPMYRLQSIKMGVRRVAFAPLHLEYGVHLTEPLVIVRRMAGMAEPD